jgi:protein TonB
LDLRLAEARAEETPPPVTQPEELPLQVMPAVEVVESPLREVPSPITEAMPGARPWRPRHLRFDRTRPPVAAEPTAERAATLPPTEPPVTPAPAPAAEETAVVVLSPQRDPATSPPPSYPRLARRYGWEGVTQVLVQVDAAGRPTGMTVQVSSGHDILDRAALEAIRGWIFHPATRNGVAESGELLVPIRFRLQAPRDGR